MHAVGPVKEESRVGRHGGATVEDMLKGRDPRSGRMGSLTGVGQLLRVAKKDEPPARAGHGKRIGEGKLAGLVDEESVDALGELRTRPEPDGTGHDVKDAFLEPGEKLGVVEGLCRRWQEWIVLVCPLADAKCLPCERGLVTTQSIRLCITA